MIRTAFRLLEKYTLGMSQHLKRDKLNQAGAFYTSEMGIANRDLTSYYSSRFVQRFVTGNRALQMGLGDGFIAAELAPLFSDFVVIEGSDEVVNSLKADLLQNYRVESSFFETFVTAELFDVIIGNHVLEHVTEPIVVLEQSRKWLRPGGKAIFTVPNANSLHRQIGVQMGLLSKINDLNDQDIALGHQRVYTLSELEADVRTAGYIIEYTLGYNIKVVTDSEMRRWPRDVLDANFEISLTLDPQICANLAIIATHE